MLKKTTLLLALASLVTAASYVQAEENYPTRPIKLIIGWAPGGPTDAIGRVLFKRVSDELKVPIIIENRPGAGGNIGAQELTRAKPDGYTLLYGTSSITTAPALFDRQDLNPKVAFDAAGCSVAVPLILLATKGVQADAVNDFYQAVADNPGKFFMGVSGTGSIDHLVGVDIGGRLAQDFQVVPYKGNGPALTDLASGNTTFMYSGSFNSAMPFISSGQVKPLAVTSGKRASALPNVPTLSESVPGLKGFDAGTWQVLLAPKGTNPAILAKLDKALQTALQDSAVQESLKFQGADLMDLDAKQCQDYINNEYDRWTDTIKRNNLKAS
jgi:tripartite-type tricarboxylate transporter receptor subunit TctC